MLKLLNIWIIMNLFYLIEYSDNYADSSGSLYQSKRDEPPMNNAEILIMLLYTIQHLLNTKQVLLMVMIDH